MNCLVTKLQSTVDDTSLERFRCLKITVKASASSTASQRFLGASPMKLQYMSGNVTFASDRTVSAGDEGTVWILKDGLVEFQQLGAPFSNTLLDLEDFKNLDGFIGFGRNSYIEAALIGDLSNLAGKAMQYFVIGSNANNGITGDIGVFSGMDNMKKVQIRGLKGVNGNINAFAGATGLTQLSIFNCAISGDITSLSSCKNITEMLVYNNDSLSGNLDALFNAWASAGKTGTLKVEIGGTAITSSRVAKDWVQHTVTFSGGSWSV